MEELQREERVAVAPGERHLHRGGRAAASTGAALACPRRERRSSRTCRRTARAQLSRRALATGSTATASLRTVATQEDAQRRGVPEAAAPGSRRWSRTARCRSSSHSRGWAAVTDLERAEDDLAANLGRSRTNRLPVGPRGTPSRAARAAATRRSPPPRSRASSSSLATSQRFMSVCSTRSRSARSSPKCALTAPTMPSSGAAIVRSARAAGPSRPRSCTSSQSHSARRLLPTPASP